MATATPTFLSLPQELRDEIYRHLLVFNLPIKCCPVRYNRDTNNPPMALLPIAILQVCRQIHDEAQDIMLKENTFIIDYRGLTYDYQGARDLHSQDVLKQASNLHIIVDIDVQRMSKVAKFLEFHICLRSLHLEFRLNPVCYFCLGEVGEAYLESFDQALDVLKKKAAQQILLKEYTFIFSEWQVLTPQWPTILKAPNLRIRVDFYDSETVGLYLALCLSSHCGLRKLHVEVTVTRLSSLETLMCPNVWDILATIPIRDSVALSVTVKDYSYRSWGVNHSVKDLQKVRKRLRSQMKEQEGWLQEQIATREPLQISSSSLQSSRSPKIAYSTNPSPIQASSRRNEHTVSTPSRKDKGHPLNMAWPFSTSTSSRHGHSSSSSRPGYARSSTGHSTSSRSSSYYKRRPRDGYIARLVHKLKHLFRELIYYARKNPAKVIFLLIPLISGGVLAGIARQFGIKLPSFLQGKGAGGGGGHGARGGGGYYGSQGYEEREGGGGMGALGALAGSAGGLMSVAKVFI
ncbi:hypothetical protein EG328_005331 [Venturia inaequalis]|uniref:Uncharacterized protein n=1 Tax=Venturia inaequalis TaxID=5025 RepID=A0A8H3ULI8_VENIN|nr:hypothetical protein EG328_005331 [Venturia inaequalis]